MEAYLICPSHLQSLDTIMNKAVEVKSLSNSELCSYIWMFYDSHNDEAFKEALARQNANELDAMHGFVESYSKLSQKNKTDISLYFSKQDIQLYNDYVREGVIGKILGDGNVNDASASILVAWIISNLFNINSIKKLTPEIWQFVMMGMKQEGDDSGKWKRSVPKRIRYALGKFSRVLYSYTSDVYYASITRVPRGSHKVSFNSTTLPDVRFNQWLTLFKAWVNQREVKHARSYSMAFRGFYEFLVEYADKNECIYDPFKYLATDPINRPSFYNWSYRTKNIDLEPVNPVSLTYMHEFCDYIILNYLTDYDDDSGDKTTFGYQLFSPAEYRTVAIRGKNIASNSPWESPKKIMPRTWMSLCKEILREKDFEWPKSRGKDYFSWTNDVGDKIQIWNPVYAYIFLIMLELPLRKIQVISLDSGEGDLEKYDIKTDSFIPNDSFHARTWKKRGNKKVNRGVMTKLFSEGREYAGLYINTNKTQDIKAQFGENSGYEIPWKNEEVLRLLSEMRDWQSQYNPVDGPLAFKDVPKTVFAKETTDTAKEMIPDRFYLFRCPAPIDGGRGIVRYDAPPQERRLYQFWYDLMAELEKRLIECGDDVSIVTVNASGQAEASIFTPHGLRASGLTAFVEVGVPIEILSKIVAGHATIINTLHYVKFNAARITEILNGAQKSIEESQQREFSAWLKNASHEDITLNAVVNDDYSVKNSTNFRDSCIFECNSVGVCPYAGTRCFDGGEIIASQGKRKTYASVKQGDCINCRHFITGGPWLIPLWLLGNKLLADARKLSLKVEEINCRLQNLEDKRYNIVKEKGAYAIPDSVSMDVKKEQSLLANATQDLDKVFNDAHKVHNLIEKIKNLSNASTKFPLMLSENFDNETPNHYVQTSNFRSLDLLVRAGEVYSHIQDSTFESERKHFIDKIMFESGVTPISFSPLSEEQKKFARDAASSYLSSKLADEDIAALEEGTISIAELGITGGEVLTSVKRISGSDIPLLLLG